MTAASCLARAAATGFYGADNRPGQISGSVCAFLAECGFRDITQKKKKRTRM